MFNYVLIGVLILYSLLVLFAGIEKLLKMRKSEKEGLDK